jgi:hypothetical protein
MKNGPLCLWRSTALLRLVEVLPDGQVGSLAALALHVAGGLKVKSQHLEDLEDLEIYGLYMVYDGLYEYCMMVFVLGC